MEKIPELIVENFLLAAVLTGVLGLIVGVLIGSIMRARRRPEDRR
ncbi:MAG TPA: hypothetical protein VH933_06215 [Aestuariivirgaceae bacterium]|jgi:ABC-type lipoprotein release transport system permease subunit